MSSSGTYSGGAPASGQLSAERAGEVWRRLDALRDRMDLRVEARAMGTGSFTISTPDESTSFLIRAGTELAEFDAALASLR